MLNKHKREQAQENNPFGDSSIDDAGTIYIGEKSFQSVKSTGGLRNRRREKIDSKELSTAIHNKQIQTGGFLWTPTGLEVVGEVTKEEWEYTGEMLGLVDSSLQWLIGDWLNMAQPEYGDTKAYAEQLGFDIGTIYEYKSVSKSVQFWVRTQNLSYGHHKLVRAMKEDEQAFWISEAENNDWSISKMRSEIKKANDEVVDIEVKSPYQKAETMLDDIYRAIPKMKSGDKLKLEKRLEAMLDKLRNS